MNEWGGRERERGQTDLLQVRHHAFLIRLRGKDIVATMADCSLGIQFQLLLIGKGEEGGGGIKKRSLEGGLDAVSDNLEETGGEASGANVIDDDLCSS